MSAGENATEINQRFDRLKTEAEAAETAGEMDRAHSLYSQCAEIRPEMWLLLAQREMVAGRRGKAIRYYVLCHNATGHEMVKQICLSNAGLIQCEWGFYPEAEAALMAGMKYGRAAALLGNLGLLRMNQCRLTEAEELLTEAVEKEPRFVQARFTRGIVRLTLCKFQLGWDDYRYRFEGAMKKIQPPAGLTYTVD